MQRLVVLGVVAACGAPPARDVAPSPRVASTPSTVAPSTIGPAQPTPLDVARTIDASIAHVWAAAPPLPAEPPPPRPRDELDDTVVAVPKARKPGRRAPCFANRDVLVGSEIWRDLTAYAIGMSSDTPPSGRYGTCTIANGQLRDARGTLLAELHCGISVHAPGIIDHLGFEIGARGADVAAAHDESLRAADATYDPPRVRTHAPTTMCWDDVTRRTRCWIESEGGNDAGSHYIFNATTKMPDLGPLEGAVARHFFESHTVESFTVQITCH